MAAFSSVIQEAMSVGYFFVSHSSKDAAAAARFVADMEAEGAKCWISSRDMPKGAWAEGIHNAIVGCDAFLLLLSKNSNDSEHVERELNLAAKYRRPIHPIRLDRTEPRKAISYFITNRQILDVGAAVAIFAESHASLSVDATPSVLHVRASGSWRRGVTTPLAIFGMILAAATAIATAYFGSKSTEAVTPPPSAPGNPSNPQPAVPVTVTVPVTVNVTNTASGPDTIVSKTKPDLPPPVLPLPKTAAPTSSPSQTREPLVSQDIPNVDQPGMLRPKTKLPEGLRPPPVVKDSHAMVPAGAGGPVRPKISFPGE